MINKYDWMNSILTSGIKALFVVTPPKVMEMCFIRYLLERPQTLWFTLKRYMMTMCQSLLSASVSTFINITGNYITHSVLMD